MIIQSTRGLLSIGIIFLFSISGIAQNQTNNWIFSIYCALDFNSGSPIPFDASTSIDTWEGSASISNNSGELLLFSDGSTVWNANQEIMPNGTSLGGDKSSTQSALIIKKPESDDIYYLFTVDDIGGPDGLRYSEIDMTLDGGLGDVTETKNVLIENSMTEKLTAVLHNNGTDIWVLSQKAGSNIYHSYLVTAEGIDMSPIETSIGEPLVDFTNASIGYLKASPNGQRLASAKLVNNEVDIFDFDNATGIMSNVITLTLSSPYGIEFSPNNSLIYVSTHAGENQGLHQFDLSVCDPEDIQGTDVFFDGSIGIQSLQTGPDGKIYGAAHIDHFLHLVEYPNNIGLDCGFLSYEIALNVGLGSGLSMIGLPNFQNSWKYDHHYLSICSEDSVALIDFNNSTHNWSLEDDFPTVISTDSIYYVSPEFTTTYVEFDDIDTIFYTVKVLGLPEAFLGNDTTLCPGETIDLYEIGNGNSFMWQDGSTDTSFTVTEPGEYWLEIVNKNCCANRDTIQVDYTIVDVSLTVDDPTITANAIADSYQWVDCNHGYDIIPGETDQTLSPESNGSYAVIITIDGCIDTSDCVEIKGYTSIGELMDENLRYFPNPTTGSITLILADYTQVKYIRVVTPEGKTLDNYSANITQLEIELPVATGLYFLQVIGNDDTISTYKIVKQ